MAATDFVRPNLSDADWYRQVSELPTDELKLLVRLLMADVQATLEKVQHVQRVVRERQSVVDAESEGP